MGKSRYELISLVRRCASDPASPEGRPIENEMSLVAPLFRSAKNTPGIKTQQGYKEVPSQSRHSVRKST